MHTRAGVGGDEATWEQSFGFDITDATSEFVFVDVVGKASMGKAEVPLGELVGKASAHVTSICVAP
jgi:hypothetical protein